MKNNKKSIITGALVAGALFGGMSLSAATTSLFQFEELGTGAQVRSQLLNQALAGNTGITLEMKCGASGTTGTTTPSTDAKKKDDKSSDAKCGDGKCGDGKCGDKKKTDTDAKKTTDVKKDAKPADDKSKDGKCGDGKCGN